MKRRIALSFCILALGAFGRPLAAQETFVVDTTLATTGKKVFVAKACNGCHTIGKGDLVAPDLGGLMARRSVDWVKNWLRDPPAMLEKDRIAKALAKQYNNMRMPNLQLSAMEIDALMHYIEIESRTMRSGNTSTQ